MILSFVLFAISCLYDTIGRIRHCLIFLRVPRVNDIIIESVTETVDDLSRIHVRAYHEILLGTLSCGG